MSECFLVAGTASLSSSCNRAAGSGSWTGTSMATVILDDGKLGLTQNYSLTRNTIQLIIMIGLRIVVTYTEMWYETLTIRLYGKMDDDSKGMKNGTCSHC